jgi:AcrR family transcriptional regulator
MPYETSGRARQKARTRQALIDAARLLVAKGLTPTVEDAAARAEISRTTAYRYFPNQRSLLVAAYPVIDAPALPGPDVPIEPEKRLDAAVKALTDRVVEHEAELRAMFRLSLDPDLPNRGDLLLRQGRRIDWIAEALAPLEPGMPPADFKRLVNAIGASVGIEVLAWLIDIAGLSRRDAVRTMRWSAGALLRSAIAERPVDGRGDQSSGMVRD